jgi:hypothetical protein
MTHDMHDQFYNLHVKLLLKMTIIILLLHSSSSQVQHLSKSHFWEFLLYKI